MIPPLLRERPDFRRLWTGRTVSLFGDQVSAIALPLVAVLVLHADAAKMGYLTAAILAPNLLFSLHLGAWVDSRGRRRQGMIGADVSRAVLLLSVPAAYLFGALSYIQLLVVGFLTGSFGVLFSVSYSTVFTSTVPRERYVEANQLVHGSRAFSFLAGPSLGGVLVQLLSAPFAVLADAGSFLVSALSLGRISSPEPEPAPLERGHLMAGLRFVRKTPVLLSSLVSAATINFFNFAFHALFILYATRVLHVRPALLGLVLGAGAVGGIIGSLATGKLVRHFGIGPVFVVGCFLFPAPVILVPLAAGAQPVILAMLFLAEFGSGFGVMMLDISGGTIQQALIPDRLRARVSGAYMFVNYGVRPLGSLLGGALATWIGMHAALWIATLGSLLGGLTLLPSCLPRLRSLPEATEAPGLESSG